MLKNVSYIFLFVCFFLAACGDDPSKPYLKIAGGGFTNSVTNNIVTYSFVVKRVKALPRASVLEASFDLPNTNRKYVVSVAADPNKNRYLFESEPLQGLKKGVAMNVKLRLLDAAGGKEIAVFEKAFVSNADQEPVL